MPKPLAVGARTPCRVGVRCRQWGLIIAMASSSLWAPQGLAAPNAPDDAVTRLLIERGLVPADAAVDSAPTSSAPPSLAQQLRDRSSDMVITAMNFLGVPYRWGGTSEATGFDCSGFTRHIFEMSLGLVLPRRADQQANAAGLLEVARNDLRPGDLVFFNTMRRTFSHVGIYVGDGKFIHSPQAGGAVRVEDMRYAYWNTRYNGARRAGPAIAVVPAVEARTER